MHSTARSSPPSTTGGSAAAPAPRPTGLHRGRDRRGRPLLRITGWTPSGALATQIPIRRYGIPLATPGSSAEPTPGGLAVHVWTIDDPPGCGAFSTSAPTGS